MILGFGAQLKDHISFLTESNPRADFAKPFAPIHPSVKSYVPQNVIYGETHTHLREMLHRYYAYTSQTGRNARFSFELQTGSVALGIELLSLIFSFYSGSIRFKYIGKGTPGLCLNLAYSTSAIAAYMGLSVSSDVNPLVECEVPYYHNQSYTPTRHTSSNNYPRVIVDGGKAFCFKSTGDDFTLHFLSAFPPGVFYEPDVNLGYRAFGEFVRAA